MRLSKYNILRHKDERYFVFNQLSGTILELNQELYSAINNNTLDTMDSQTIDVLFRNGVLCLDDLVENQIIIARNRQQRYGNRTVRLTIMPTMNCNFKCWYCYERHVESAISDSTINAILLFSKRLIEENNLTQFHLDWFGGEPLMLFDEVVYLVSKQIKAYCASKHIEFVNSMTTNGYLINEEVGQKMREITLSSIQITLDGEKKIHNRTRFTATDKNTYDKIVANIELLCRKIEFLSVDLRINYTVQNIATINQIAESFPSDIRHKIVISPHIVWQHANRIANKTEILEEQINHFKSKGYPVQSYMHNPKRCIACYVENMLQFVVNYDGKVYKCTAQDFTEKRSVGRLNADGNFIPTPLYFKYFATNSAFERDECMQCEFLPSCQTTCVRKVMDGVDFHCSKEEVRSAINKQIDLMIDHHANRI